MPVDVLVPPLGTNVDTLVLVEWYRQEGDTVEKDEPLFAVETDKATLDVEAPASGVLRRVFAQPGQEVTALSRIALIVPLGETWDEGRDGRDEGRGMREEGSSRFPLTAEPEIPSLSYTAATHTGRTFISPRAKRLAEANQVGWQSLSGTGPEGAIVERDVRAFLETAPTETDEDVLETVPMTGVRAVIAARMSQSAAATVPVTLTTEADATELVAWRRRLRDEGVTVSYNDLLLTLLAQALPEHPRLNATRQGDVIKVRRRVHIGLAVDAQEGLRVPVVRDVDRKSLPEIARETAALVEAARTGTLAPDSQRGATFTLTNLGMFGIDAFTPVINLPECAILGVGRIEPRPSVVEDQVVIRQKMWLSLTFDHRLVDGGPAARFLQRVAQLIESLGQNTQEKRTGGQK